jgi:hypothetical protein
MFWMPWMLDALKVERSPDHFFGGMAYVVRQNLCMCYVPVG